MTVTPPVISALDLAAALDAGDDVVVLEVRRDRHTLPVGVHLPTADDGPAGHVPGAHLVDFAQLVGPRTETSGNSPLPEAAQVRELVRRWGIHDSSVIVVYSPDHPSTASRVWWVLRWAGLRDVRYLDGGLSAWLAAGRQLGDLRPVGGGGTAQVRPGSLPTLDAASAAALARDGHLLDARGSGAYAGAGDDAAGGHIPGAHSLPGIDNLRDGYLADADILRELYAPYLTGAPIGSYCGGGVAATLDVLALSTIGVSAALYPGSWSQWTTDPSRPIATGALPG
ncbi:sulfurtransferase [Nocardia alba]|uniref:thiosulfate sulfurtransferase n=1 Tax=Nocardia alba TaxID=225051 RepID=A0A4V2PB12_9NOCA|nr:rhodanese-like domain-containing protein [Nocardia alba]TCJ95645.1 thiosulfate/3-mercaptopyruvate sulfurtransferase [Nocardia alba]